MLQTVNLGKVHAPHHYAGKLNIVHPQGIYHNIGGLSVQIECHFCQAAPGIGFEEQVMDPDFWHGLWSRGHIGFHQHDFNKHMQSFVSALDVPPGGHIFVPLCGKSLDMLWLLRQGYRVTGVEISTRAVEDFFEENELPCEVTALDGVQLYSSENLVIYCADFFEVELTHTPQIDAVYDRASLIALPQALRAPYVNRLTGLLSPGTRSLLVTLDYPQQQMSGPPFSVTPLEVEELFGDLYEIKKIHSEDCLANEPRFIKKGLTRLEEHVFLLKKNR